MLILYHHRTQGRAVEAVATWRAGILARMATSADRGFGCTLDAPAFRIREGEFRGPGQREWAERFEREHPNFRAALDWLEANARWEEA